jgi:hypothetical protein
MPIIEMIVLAKSKKLGGRCIAGLRVDGGGWVRPVAPSPDGTLFPQHYALTNGSQAEVLDVVKIEVKEPRPERYQPENWVISDKKWKLISRPGSEEHQSTLWDSIVSGPTLLGNQSDRIHVRKFEDQPAKASLALIMPSKIEWTIGIDVRGHRQTRAIFKLKGTTYDLAVTDEAWKKHLGKLPEGSYPVKSGEGFLLTISLSEPFNNYCYKLVSSVLRIE